MKNKILKTFLFFVLFSTLLITVSFAVEIKEDVADYESDVYIIGSTRFEANQTITATMAANAGINEAKVQVALKKDISNLKVNIYFYDAIFGDWYEINKAAKADLIEDTTTIKNIEDNLNIFYEEGVEKTLEVKYNGNVDTTSITNGVEYKEGKFLVPATTFSFKFSEIKEVNGEEVVVANEVSTNVDKNINTGTESKPEVDIISENYVAKVGSEYFKDLDSAIVKASAEEPVILINDLEISKQIVITKKVTLDFNGKTITVVEDLEDISAIVVLEGGDLIITGNGTLNSATQGNDYSIAVWAKETGKATIKNGTFKNVGAKSIDDNGVANNNEMIYVSGSGVITIEDGTFTGNTENEKWGTHYTLNAHDASYNAGTAKIIVKGGTYTGFNPANNEAEGKNTNFVADGYKVVTSDGKYTVVEIEETDVILGDGVAYSDLQTAVNNASYVKLLKDIELETKLDVKKDLILDLNGKTLKASETLANLMLILVSDGAKLTINGDGLVNSATQGIASSKAIWAYYSEVVINGGTFTNLGGKVADENGEIKNNELIYATGTGKVTINGGTFIGNTKNEKFGAGFTLNLLDSDYDAGTAKIIVKGGTYTAFNPANNEAEGPDTNFVAEGYESIFDETNNTYTVVEKVN